jgi:hypothetical protein
MTTQVFVLLLIGTVLAVYVGIALTTWIRMRGARVVVCPQTHESVSVTLDRCQAAMSAVWEAEDLKLATCTRWPLPVDCDQACVKQIVQPGNETLPAAIAAHLFEGQRCAICGLAIDPLGAVELPPGLLDPVTHDVVAWNEVPPERLRDEFKARRALCANCTLAESFRRRFPDRVVDRLPRPGITGYAEDAQPVGATRNT